MTADRKRRLYTPELRRDAISQICAVLVAEVKPILAVTAEALGEHGGTVGDLHDALNTALDELEKMS